ncbi:MAG: hypothetical protein HUK21_02810 [Fibrobacteraceae bacterium]|nr:hypothetical protein [Fibrobacteraceae bacterium]
MSFSYQFGRRPKGDGFDSSVPFPNEEEPEEIEEEEEEVDEEVDFDNPTFKRDQIWSDYAEDLDYDQ